MMQQDLCLPNGQFIGRNVSGPLSQFKAFPQTVTIERIQAMALHAKVTIGTTTLTHLPAVMDTVRLCCALPLLPQHVIQRGLNVIGLDAMGFGEEVYNIARPFLQYVQFEWLNHPEAAVCQSVEAIIGQIMQGNLANFEDDVVDDLWSISQGLIPTRHRAGSSVRNDAYIGYITRELLQDGEPNDEAILHFLCRAVHSLDQIVIDAIF